MAAKEKISTKNNKESDKLVYKLEEISRISHLDAKVIETGKRNFIFSTRGKPALVPKSSGRKIWPSFSG